MLQHAPNGPLDVDGFDFPMLVSEKLNGFRCLVIGGQLYSKSVRPHANRHLATHLRDLLNLAATGWVFDCELYSDRMTFTEIQSVLQSHDAMIPDHLHAHVFDALTITEWFSSRVRRFDFRMSRYTELLQVRSPAHTTIHPHMLVTSMSELELMYGCTLAQGGEGLMLRSPSGGYKHGRCSHRDGTIFKMKPETLSKSVALQPVA